MSKYIDVKLDSTRTIRIDATRLSHVEHQTVIGALRNVGLLMDGFALVAKKIEQFSARLFLKPSLKH